MLINTKVVVIFIEGDRVTWRRGVALGVAKRDIKCEIVLTKGRRQQRLLMTIRIREDKVESLIFPMQRLLMQ